MNYLGRNKAKIKKIRFTIHVLLIFHGVSPWMLYNWDNPDAECLQLDADLLELISHVTFHKWAQYNTAALFRIVI